MSQSETGSFKNRTKATKNKKYLHSLSQLSDITEIETAIRKTFQDSQTTVSVHRRQVATLKAIQKRCYEIRLSKQFNAIFCKMINKILRIKKTESVGDRLVKFVASFTGEICPPEDTDENSFESRLYMDYVNMLANHLIKGFEAQDKQVRYRVCHLLSHLMHRMNYIDADLYEALSENLLVRLYDKEASVRVKAVTTLASFQEEDYAAQTSEAAKKIRFVMQNDTNPEVRKTCLNQVEKTRGTLEYVYERARDVVAANRKYVYSHVLPSIRLDVITPKARDVLLSWGLKDRDEEVRKATARWFTDTWFTQCENNIFELLNALNVMKSDIAEVAVRAFFDDKAEFAEKLAIKKEHFDDLTSEYALLFRVFFEYCNDNNLGDLVEKNFPVTTAYSELLEHYFSERSKYIHLYELYEKQEPDADGHVPDFSELKDTREYDYILTELLKIAVDYDYSDEFGRSRMLLVLRNRLEKDTLPDSIVQYLLQCIRKLSISERDFSQMIVEIINDLKDFAYETIKPTAENVNEDEDENESDDDIDDLSSSSGVYQDARAELSRASINSANKSMQHELQQVQELSPEVLMNCLTISKRLLELVHEPLKDNMYLMSLLESLIHPAVRRNEVQVRGLAIDCLGLCCLLDKQLAADSMFLFCIFATKGESDELAIGGLRCMSDLLAIHGISILETGSDNAVDTMAVAKAFYKNLVSPVRKGVQATAGEALFKLFLCDVITDDELFEATLITYFSPLIDQNEALKQCFAFCIPAYAFSHPNHQHRMIRVVADTLDRVFGKWAEKMETASEDFKLNPDKVIEQLLFWTNPSNMINRTTQDETDDSSMLADVILQLLAYLCRIFAVDGNKDFIKAILKHLPKISIDKNAGLEKLKKIYKTLVDEELLYGDLEAGLKMTNGKKNYDAFKLKIENCIKEAEELEVNKEPTDVEPQLDNAEEQNNSRTEFPAHNDEEEDDNDSSSLFGDEEGDTRDRSPERHHEEVATSVIHSEPRSASISRTSAKPDIREDDLSVIESESTPVKVKKEKRIKSEPSESSMYNTSSRKRAREIDDIHDDSFDSQISKRTKVYIPDDSLIVISDSDSEDESDSLMVPQTSFADPIELDDD